MQKTRKRSEPSTHNGWGRSPDVVSIDVLGAMLDDDLVLRLRALENGHNEAFSDAYASLRPWEEEIAYVRREQHIRRSRRDAHSDYIKRSEEERAADARREESLPAGDFDNSSFVNAASGRPRWS